jgi:transposase
VCRVERRAARGALSATLSALASWLGASPHGDGTRLRRVGAGTGAESGSTLTGLRGLADRSTAELIAEVGDPRRFTEGGFARFNGCAPLPCSSGEGGGQPVRHRFNPGGYRRVNAVLHHMAITQLRCEPRARELYDHARLRGHTNTEAMRVLKRRLSDVVYRRMIHDATARYETAPLT